MSWKWIAAAVAVWWFFFRTPDSVLMPAGPADPTQPLPGSPNSGSCCGDGAPKGQQTLQMPRARGTSGPTLYGGGGGVFSRGGRAPEVMPRDQITSGWFADFVGDRPTTDAQNKFYTSPVGQI